MPFKPIETQEELDALIKERLERERTKVRTEFEDYAELKQKAEELDKLKESEMTELEKAKKRIGELEGEATKRAEADKLNELKAKVAKSTGVPAELLVGSDEESLTQYAEKLGEYAKGVKPSAPELNDAGNFSDKSGTSDDGMRKMLEALKL